MKTPGKSEADKQVYREEKQRLRDDKVWTAARVKALRADLKLTLKEFGDRCGVSMRAVQNWTLPECSVNHRNPSGSACLILERLEKEARRNRGPIPDRDIA